MKLLGELPPYDAPTPSYAEKPAGEGEGDEGKEPGEEPSPKEDSSPESSPDGDNPEN